MGERDASSPPCYRGLGGIWAAFLLLLPFAANAQVRRIPVEELADAYARGSVGLVSPQKAGGVLTWAAAEGAGYPPKTLLTSATTRTPGLIAAIDFTFEGVTPRAIPGEATDLLEFKWRVEATENSKNFVLGLFGGLAGVGLLFAIAATLRPKLRYPAHGFLTFGAASTTGMLLFSLIGQKAPALGFQASAFLAVSGFLALLAHGLRRRVRPVRLLLLLLVLTLALDTVFHLGLAANSALSGFYISGIRFYGIGNEYMGLLIGAVLMATPRRFLGVAGVGTVLLLGLSPLGANAGGAMAATVAFAMCPLDSKLCPLTPSNGGMPPLNSPVAGGWVAVLRAGRWRVPLAFMAAILVAVALAAVERFVLPPEARSHIGRAAGGGPALWGQIILRKLVMNLRIALMPWTLVGAAGVGGALWLTAKGKVGERVRETLARDADLASRIPAAGWGAVAALVFNDSGIVAALLLLAPVLFAVVESCLCDTLPSTSEPGASGLPSATTT